MTRPDAPFAPMRLASRCAASYHAPKVPDVSTAHAHPARPAFVMAALALALAACSSSQARAPASTPEKETTMQHDSTARPLVIAHRGFRAIAPENTLRALDAARAAGSPWWELDVAASSDGTLVVIHDDTLVRTTNAALAFPDRKPWSVYDFSAAELRALDAGSWYLAADPFRQLASGAVTREIAASFAGERIPTLREALERTRAHGMKVNVEIKDATGHPCDAWIVERCVALIEELGMSGDVLISSFNHEYLARVRAATKKIEVAALVDKPIPDPVAVLKSLGALAYHPNWKRLDEATVRAVRQAGFEVNVWTINEEADMRRMLEWGVTGLITDFPDRALAVARGTSP